MGFGSKGDEYIRISWVSGEFSIKKDGYLIIKKNAVGLAWDLEVKVMNIRISWVSGEFSIKKDGYLIDTKNAVGLA